MNDLARQKKLNRLIEYRAAYGIELSKRLDVIADSWRQAVGSDTWGSAYQALYIQVHSLAGSAGTFGYDRVGQCAKQLETLLTPCAQQSLPPPAAQHPQIIQLLTSLRQLTQEETVGAIPYTNDVCTPVASTAYTERRLAIIEDDPLLAEQLATQLRMYGWEPTNFSNVTQAAQQLPTLNPAAMIVDVILPEGWLAGAELIQRLQINEGRHLPHIVISSRWDWDARLAAARAGADAYFVKPVDFAAIAGALERLVQHHPVPPYRILILDDDAILADHYAQVLANAGMNTLAIADPAQILDTLGEHQPELMLMDLYMPSYSGIEVARIIRQDPQYVSMPIVFLSTESGLAQQQQAMLTGADDFLQKPIADPDLVLTVSVRAERFRALTALIRQDSMTGLLNHISFKLRLEAELDRSRRNNKPLTLALLDIDHFKKVNDTYGHPLGDQVIKSLAQLLRYRLRKSDLAGRYGGEEFVILLPETTVAPAQQILDELRLQFSQLCFMSTHGSFSCTFSAGVVCPPPGCGMEVLIRATDEALYQAKHAGRNQVIAGTAVP